MDQNPYEAPIVPCVTKLPVPERPVVVFDPVVVRTLIRPPALILIVLAALSIPVDLAALAHAIFFEIPKWAQDVAVSDDFVALLISIAGYLFLIFFHVFVIFGMWHMWRLKTYKYAALAMAISICPVIAPGFLLGIPFAIWAHFVLKRADVQAAFHT